MQGSAADLVKGAMIALHNAFEQWQPEAPGTASMRPHLLVQIHDELLFEVMMLVACSRIVKAGTSE